VATSILHPNPPVATKRGAKLASSGELVREPLQSSLDYGLLSVSAYLNASERFRQTAALSMDAPIWQTNHASKLETDSAS
jgi:hypothetical protein